jgi:molybdate transport system ATP-binding protein
MIFQDDLLFPHRNVAGNIRYGLQGWNRGDAEERVRAVAHLCGVESLLDRRPEFLSGGERQRVGLARALAPRPRLLLCDEPVSALDLASRHVLLMRLQDIQRVERIPILYVTHAPNEAMFLGTRMFLLDAGRIVAEGEPLELLVDQVGAIRGDFGGLSNVFHAKVEGHATAGGETFLRLPDGPVLAIPHRAEWDVGRTVLVTVRADEILLARDPTGGLSARNMIAGTVERIFPHGGDAEVIVRTGATRWAVSVVAQAVAALELQPGCNAYLIIKARSFQLAADPP